MNHRTPLIAGIPVMLLLVGCGLMTGGGSPGTAQNPLAPVQSSPPVVCRDLLVMDLETAREIIDNANSPNGNVNDGDTPMTRTEMAVLGRDAQKLDSYAARVSGPLRSAVQAEALAFSEAANSPNGTVTNDTAVATDTAYKNISAECPS
jgi:hypothetical protein